CHVGFAIGAQPYVIPTLHVRVADRLYIHGSAASRMLGAAAAGTPLAVTVTHIDGLVLARSAFHHSMNYHSVVVLGTASVVNEAEKKHEVLHALTDHLIRGRWEEIRHPSSDELRRTLVLAIPIEEASAKIRTGPPLDDEEDYALSVWAGVLPLKITPRSPLPDDRLPKQIAVPEYVRQY